MLSRISSAMGVSPEDAHTEHVPEAPEPAQEAPLLPPDHSIVHRHEVKEEVITDDKLEVFTVTTTTQQVPIVQFQLDGSLPLALRKPKRNCRKPDWYKPVERPTDDYDDGSEEEGWDEDSGSDIEDGDYDDDDEDDDNGADLEGFIIEDEEGDDDYQESSDESEMADHDDSDMSDDCGEEDDVCDSHI